jgi:hypothetical protein
MARLHHPVERPAVESSRHARPGEPPAAAGRPGGPSTDSVTARPRPTVPQDTGDAGGRGFDSGSGQAADATTSASPALTAPPAQVPRVPVTAPPAGDTLTEPGPAGAPGQATGWAGLLLLLATAARAGLPDAVLTDPALAARGVRWAVWRAGLALTESRPDDPAVLALCGLDPDRAGLVLETQPPTPAESRGAALLAARWRRVTLARLRAASHGLDELPARRHQWDWLVRRPGHIAATQGWIDIVLPRDSVSLAVRSAGLDLDPGFVPWLGTVLEFRYE